VAKLERAHRQTARGTDEATPVRALFGVATIVAAAVAIVLLIAILLWIFLR
jgi:hypothetical protein